MTSFYSWRLMFLTFYGTPRGDRHTHEHAHESPAVMTVPLAVLAVGSVLAGMVFYGPYFGSQEKVDKFFGITDVEPAAHASDRIPGAAIAATDEEAHERPHQTPGEGAIYIGDENHVIHEAHEVPWLVKVSPFVAMLVGFVAAWIAYIRTPSLPRQWAETLAPLHRFLLNKWYFDEIYEAVFVRPAKAIGRFLWRKGDGTVIDGSINGLAMGIVPFATKWLNRAQSGYIFTYAFAMVLGIVALVTLTTIGSGG